MTPSDESVLKFEINDGRTTLGANLSKRELFAALAMQGLLSNMNEIDFDAELAVSCADALLVELSRTSEGGE